jgi:hypothetical protein
MAQLLGYNGIRGDRGAGFIGSRLVDSLLTRAFAAISLDAVVAALITTLPTLGLLTGFGGVQ